MGDEALRSDAAQAEPRPAPLRRVPSQKRAQERVARILAVATDLILERGIDAVRMSEIAERAEISIGSLYQYFPDKPAIVGSLAERYNAEGRACVAGELATVRTPEDLHPALIRIVDGYYAMFQELPAMRAIWQAMQADAALQAQDAEDGAAHAAMLDAALQRLWPDSDDARRRVAAALLIQLIAAAVRFAIALPAADGAMAIALFKRTLPRDLASLCSEAPAISP